MWFYTKLGYKFHRNLNQNTIYKKPINIKKKKSSKMYSSSNANTFNWDKTTTLKFIKRRIKEDVNFNGKPNSATVGYMTIVQDLGIPITEKQARSKWQNLVYKYKELKRYLDGSDEGYDKAVNSWPFFDVLDKFFTKKQILTFHNSPDENDEFIKTNFLSNNGSPANNGNSFHQDFSVVNTDWIKNEIIDENEENFDTDDFNDEMAAYQHHHSQNLPTLMSAVNHNNSSSRPENLNRSTHNNSSSNTNNNNNSSSNNHNNHINNNSNNTNNNSNINSNNGHHNQNSHNNISNGNKMNNDENHQFLKSCKYEDSVPSRDEMKRKSLKRRLHHDPPFIPNNSGSSATTNPPPLFFPPTINNHPPPLAIIDPLVQSNNHNNKNTNNNNNLLYSSDDNFDDIMFQPNLSDTAILKEIHEIKEVVLKNNEYIQNLNDRTKSIENKLDLVMATLQKLIERDQPKIKIEDNSNSSLSFPEEFKKFNGE